jgi:hypothetical protein
VTRLLLDADRLEAGEVALRMARAVSVGVTPARAAAWVEGFLSESGLLLVHDAGLLGLVDSWITGLPADGFTDVLPLLRRTFGAFTAPERRAIGERVRRSPPGTADASGTIPGAPAGEQLDLARSAPAVRTVAAILGLEAAPPGTEATASGAAIEVPGPAARTSGPEAGASAAAAGVPGLGPTPGGEEVTR